MGKKRKNKSRKQLKVLRDAEGRFQGSVSSAPVPYTPPNIISQVVAPEEVQKVGAGHSNDVGAVYMALKNSHNLSISSPQNSYRGRIASEVADDLGISTSVILDALSEWEKADSLDFEDRAAPSEKYRYDLHPDAPQGKNEQRALRKLGYEHFLKQLHPVFVYGTLREGQGNSVLMDRARLQTVRAEMPSVSMYTKHWGFPYAKEDSDPSRSIVGEIVWLDDSEEGDEARRSLDYLEGFNSDFPSHSHYERVERTVQYRTEPDGPLRSTKVWVYFARGAAAQSLTHEDRLDSGDWVEASRYRRR